jgi:hypothetical protein
MACVQVCLRLDARDPFDRLAIHYRYSITQLIEELAMSAEHTVEAKLTCKALEECRTAGLYEACNCELRPHGETMGNGVVSIRVEALGVSITIVDGNIAIEQKELPVATSVSEVKNSTAASRQAGPKPYRISWKSGTGFAYQRSAPGKWTPSLT